MSRGRAAIYAIGAVALALGLWAAAAQLSSPPSRVEATYSKDNGYFYRMTAKFTVKETGEELDFDYVVACNIRVIRWRDGGLSDDSTYSPRVMVKATAGGQAVMVKTLRLCDGVYSQNGDVPPDVLPLAIWFDSVDDLSKGLGYVSEGGYDNPLSKLTFRGARIDPATRADWEAWRKKAADEYVQRGALPGPWGANPSDFNARHPDSDRFVVVCHGYSRLKLPEDMRAKLRELWSPERPQFWTLPNADSSKIGDILSDPKQPSPPGIGSWFARWGSLSEISSSGLPVRSGRQVQRAPHVPSRWPSEAYPFLWPPLVSAYPVTVMLPSSSTEVYVQKLDFRDGTLNGFAVCQEGGEGSPVSFAAADPRWRAKRHVFMVDDDVLRQLEQGTISSLAPTWVVERDEYVFRKFSTGL